MKMAMVQTLKARGTEGVDCPTVVIAASIGYVVRNYLLGKCMSRLREQSRVVVLSPLAGEESFREAMEERGAEVLPLKAPVMDSSWTRLRTWRTALHVARLNTETFRLKRTPDHHQSSWLARLWNRLTLQVARAAAGSGALRWIDAREQQYASRSTAADYYRQLFTRIRPSLVFSPAPLVPDEWLPIQVARSMQIKTVLSVLSWDNLSSKSRLPVPCSTVLVWSEEMRRELLEYYPETLPEQVCVTGPPPFDFYFQREFHDSREAFLGRIGADPSRPVIVYAGVTPSLMPDEPKIIENLIKAIRRGEVRHAPQLLVRLHPKDDGSRYGEFQMNYPEVIFTVPGDRSRGVLKDWQPDEDDVKLLVNTVRHADVLINVASTMTLDAAVMDRPVINVKFDLRSPGTRPSWGLRVYECTHYLPVPKTGGVRMAETPEELIEHVNAYLENPALDREGRHRMVQLECGQLDGRAGERVAAKLLEMAGLPIWSAAGV